MAPPKVTTTDTFGEWINIDDQVWLVKIEDENLRDAGLYIAAHNDPTTGEQCRHSPAHLTGHTLVSEDPLHFEPSLACGACSWHGWIRDGKWMPA